MRPEEGVHFAICDYIRLAYAKVMFISESSGVRTSIGLASKLKRTRSNHVHCDLYILYPNSRYHGLILELKAKSIYQKKNPQLMLKDDHLADQAETIKKLNLLGYFASFACGFDEARSIIDKYMTIK